MAMQFDQFVEVVDDRVWNMGHGTGCEVNPGRKLSRPGLLSSALARRAAEHLVRPWRPLYRSASETGNRAGAGPPARKHS
jgi:hypothetical protein